MRIAKILTLLPFLFTQCGEDPHQILKRAPDSISYGEVSPDLEYQLGKDGLELADESITQVTLTDNGTAGTADPAGIPVETTSTLTIVFNATIDWSKNTAFKYDPKYWAIAINYGVSVTPLPASTTFTVSNGIAVDDSGFTEGSQKRQGTVKLVLTLAADFYTKYAYTLNGSKRVTLLPIYSTKGGGPSDGATLNGLKEVSLKSDQGMIQGSPTLSQIEGLDESVYIQWTPPTDLAALKADGSGGLTAVGDTSSIGGYLVVFWKHQDCANEGAWKFKSNPEVVATEAQSCAYKSTSVFSTSGTRCNLGCTDASKPTSKLSLEDIAVPSDIPTSTGLANAKVVGCYRVIRVAGSSASLNISGLENNVKYGAMVFPLDSAGHVGKNPSQCMSAMPLRIPLPSDRGSEAPRTQEDCFVATAASGSTQSNTVLFWRILRDRYLTSLGIADWYYRNSKPWAAEIAKHPKISSATNFVLERSGSLFVHWDRQLQKAKQWMQSAAYFVRKAFWFEEAQAQDAQTQSEVKPNLKSTISGSLTVSYSVFNPTKDTAVYEEWSMKSSTKPYRLAVSQTFTILNIGGELGVGGQFYYLVAAGKEPDSVTQQRRTSSGSSGEENSIDSDRMYYVFGFGGMLDYRMRFGNLPWLAPRLTAIASYDRSREEARLSDTTAEKQAKEDGGEIKINGVSEWAPTYAVRAALEWSLITFGTESDKQNAIGYDAKDFFLSMYFETVTDTGKVRPSLTGTHMGLGLGLLF